MTLLSRSRSLMLALAAATATMSAQAQIQITEWMYNGNGPTGEYVEFTNLGSTAVNFAGWSFADSARTPGLVSLTALGIVAPGQSVILTEATAADFRAAWGLSSSVAVLGGNTANLGRADEMNIFDASGQLVDRFTYGDQTFAGSIRAQNASGNPLALSDLTTTTVTGGWVLASNGDAFGSHTSTLGDVGSPGQYAQAVPEPTNLAMLMAGLGVIGFVVRRRRQS